MRMLRIVFTVVNRSRLFEENTTAEPAAKSSTRNVHYSFQVQTLEIPGQSVSVGPVKP